MVPKPAVLMVKLANFPLCPRSQRDFCQSDALVAGVFRLISILAVSHSRGLQNKRCTNCEVKCSRMRFPVPLCNTAPCPALHKVAKMPRVRPSARFPLYAPTCSVPYRSAFAGKGLQRRSQKWLHRRLEGVAEVVGGGYCR